MYINNLNKEIKKYFRILSKEYPSFINKYIQTDEMQRLSGIGLFCGCDYSNLFSCKYWFSRLDHSIATALMIYNFTKSKEQILGALFHDLGTPTFSHSIDFMLSDSVNQESSEINVKDVLLSSKKIIRYLEKDNINIDDVTHIEKYTILENKKPKLCVDRLEGVLSTGLVWYYFWTIEEIEEIYNDISVLINEENEQEIGFKNIEVANNFYEGVYKYSIVLQQNEDKFAMQFIADNVKYLIDNSIIKLEDLYKLSEKQVIEIIKDNTSLKEKWTVFENADKIKRTNDRPDVEYYISNVNSKKRHVIPLVDFEGNTVRLNKVSKKCGELLEKYLSFEDSVYAYIDL